MDEPTRDDEEKTLQTGQQPDRSEPSPERQAQLRGAYESNIAVGFEPYAFVRIHTLGEVLWIQQERGWLANSDTPVDRRINLRACLAMAGSRTAYPSPVGISPA